MPAIHASSFLRGRLYNGTLAASTIEDRMDRYIDIFRRSAGDNSNTGDYLLLTEWGEA